MQRIIQGAEARSRFSTLGFVIIFGLAAQGQVLAQTTGASAQASGSGTGLEEIVVTAEKVQSTAQRTPATIQVVNSETLARQNIVVVSDLNSILTDAQIVPIGTATQIYIRGIGSSFIDPRADPVVATSINGLFFARPLPVGYGFLDVSRVEVLEGPQGTLYGRNSAAGAVNIVTNRPTQEFGGSISATGGNLGANDFTGVLNLPLTSDLAIRLAGDRDRRDGYIAHYYDDINNDSGRISALWTPGALTVYAESGYSRIGGHGSFTESWPCAPSTAWSLYVPKTCAPTGLRSGTAPLTGSEGSFVTTEQLQVDYDFNWATLTSITGFVGTHERNYNSANGAAFTNTIKINSDDYSEEIRLAGHDSASHQGGLAWQLGAYFFDSTGNYFSGVQVPGSNLPPTGIFTFSKVPQSSQAAYAQATYGLIDGLRITAGIRYINDFKAINYGFQSYAPPTFTTLATPITGTSSYSGDKVIYKGGIEYDVAPGKLLYADVSTGYVSGGANGGNAASTLPPNVTPSIFLPETITAYEVGSKNRFFNNRLQLNGEVYYYDFHNYQYLYPSLIQGGPPGHEALNIQNASAASAYGVGLNAEYALTKDDRFSAAVAWTHATYGAISLDAFTPPFGPAYTIHVPSGTPLTNDPDWTGLLGYEHTWRFDQGSSVTLSANSKLSSKYLDVIGSHDPYDTQKAYTMTDASLAYHWLHDKYVVRVWGKNLENSKVNIYGEGQTFHLYEIEPPRTYGVTVSANF